MHKVSFASLILILGAGLLFAQHERHSRSVTVTSDNDSAGDSCSDRMRTGFDFKSHVEDESTVALPNQPLQIKAQQNGGIQVTTWDQAGFSVKLCKQAASDSESRAREILNETQISDKGSEVSVTGPKGGNDYSVATVLLVEAPKDAVVNLAAHNGGISLKGFTGTAEAETKNGGISLHHSSGKLTVKAENGGISIGDCSGEVSVTVQNGGLSVALPERWEGKGLEAHLQNGGLNISVPKNFSAGLEVSGSNYVHFACKASACDGAEQIAENGRRVLRIGGANPQIRATTGNGGVTIHERDDQGSI